MKPKWVVRVLAGLALMLGGSILGAAEPPAEKQPSPPSEARASTFRRIAPPLPAGTYHAVTAGGVRLSGIIASPGDTSFSKMPTTQATPRSPRAMPKIRTIDPNLRYQRR